MNSNAAIIIGPTIVVQAQQPADSVGNRVTTAPSIVVEHSPARKWKGVVREEETKSTNINVTESEQHPKWRRLHQSQSQPQPSATAEVPQPQLLSQSPAGIQNEVMQQHQDESQKTTIQVTEDEEQQQPQRPQRQEQQQPQQQLKNDEETLPPNQEVVPSNGWRNLSIGLKWRAKLVARARACGTNKALAVRAEAPDDCPAEPTIDSESVDTSSETDNPAVEPAEETEANREKRLSSVQMVKAVAAVGKKWRAIRTPHAPRAPSTGTRGGPQAPATSPSEVDLASLSAVDIGQLMLKHCPRYHNVTVEIDDKTYHYHELFALHEIDGAMLSDIENDEINEVVRHFPPCLSEYLFAPASPCCSDWPFVIIRNCSHLTNLSPTTPSPCLLRQSPLSCLKWASRVSSTDESCTALWSHCARPCPRTQLPFWA